MKKIAGVLIVALLCLVCIPIYACDPLYYQMKDTGVLDDEIVSVQLIRYDNPKQKAFKLWAQTGTRKLKTFNLEKMEVVETLSEDQIPNLLLELGELETLGGYYTYDSPQGECLKLNYSNGNFLIIWGDAQKGSYVGTYSPEGKVVYYAGAIDFLDKYADIVEKFFKLKA